MLTSNFEQQKRKADFEANPVQSSFPASPPQENGNAFRDIGFTCKSLLGKGEVSVPVGSSGVIQRCSKFDNVEEIVSCKSTSKDYSVVVVGVQLCAMRLGGWDTDLTIRCTVRPTWGLQPAARQID